MSEQRRAELEALLAADEQAHAEPTSRMSLVCARCVSELAVSGAGATVLTQLGDGDGPHTRRGLVHATNETSAGLEDLQLTVGEGPCLDAFLNGGPVLIDDLSKATERWPAFTPEARKLGAAAVFSFPLQVGVIRLGSLDCYRARPGELGQTAVSDAMLLADLATQALMSELDGHATEDLAWLADPHAEIHQATGMVKVQLSVPTETALLRLRAHAYTYELPLAQVAHQVVGRQLRFHPDPDIQA